MQPLAPIRFTGGKYNGLTGTLRWVGDIWAQVVIIYDNKPHEVLEELRHMAPLEPQPAS